MGLLTWNTDVNAPCCPGEIVSEDGRTFLIDTDWDYPGTATTFGWSIELVQEPERAESCSHNGDGTVNCNHCKMTASDFISAAYDWLVEHNGATADDPGYFP